MHRKLFIAAFFITISLPAFAACIPAHEYVTAVHNNGNGWITEYYADGSQFTSMRDYNLALANMRRQHQAGFCQNT